MTPDLDWVPVSDAIKTGTKQNYRHRLEFWRKRRRRKLTIIFTAYSVLFFVVFFASMIFFAGMGLSPEQHKSLVNYFAMHMSLASAKEPPLPSQFDDKRELFLLLVGLDKEPPHRSDSVMVAHIDLVNYETRIVSIPRDLYCEVLTKKGRPYKDKLAHAYVYGGIDDVKYAVDKLFDISVDYHIVTKIGGMEKLIDEVGGVWIDVEKDMRYRDRAQDLNINIKKGFQVLDGKNAVDYSRFRRDAEGDNGRMRRQQELIKAILVEMRKPNNLLKINRILQLAHESFETDIAIGQFLALKEVASEFTPDKIQSLTLFTDSMMSDGISYQFVTEDDLAAARDFLMDLSPPLPEVEEGVEGVENEIGKVQTARANELTASLND